MSTMGRAVMFTAKGKVELVDSPVDDRPLGPREVAGRTLATIVSPGTELSGGLLGDSFPTQRGYAAVAEVEAVGAEVDDLAPGERVFVMGPHRSWQRATRENLVRVPDGLSAAQASFCRLMGVSLTTLMTTRARPPAYVMVTGLGPVGHLAAQNFAACGYQAIGVDPSEPRRALAASKGTPVVLPAVPVDDPEYRGRIHLAMDCSGHEAAVLDACRVIRKGGEVVLIGTPWRRRTDLPAHDLTHAVFHNYVHLRSGWEWELPRQPQDFAPSSVYENFAHALRWLAEGKVDVAGLADVHRPDDCQAAFDGLLRQEGGLTRVFDWVGG